MSTALSFLLGGRSFLQNPLTHLCGVGLELLELRLDGELLAPHAYRLEPGGLVLLAAQYTHKTRRKDSPQPAPPSPALEWAAQCLQSKGNSPRQYANTLVFLAPDQENLENLFQAIADQRAWQKVIDEKLLLQITVNQENHPRDLVPPVGSSSKPARQPRAFLG